VDEDKEYHMGEDLMTDITISKEKVEEEIRQTTELMSNASGRIRETLILGNLSETSDIVMKLAELRGKKYALLSVIQDKFKEV